MNKSFGIGPTSNSSGTSYSNGPTSNSNSTKRKRQRVLPNIPRGEWRRIEGSVIDKRWDAVKHNPDLKVLEPWNLSDVFYRTRKKLQDMGYDVTDLVKVRNKIHTHVKEYCEKRGKKRHELGIFAADRAVLAYEGHLYSVGFESIIELARLGTDIICIEKKGIVDKLVRHTKDFGVALLQSQGFMSEYGQMLVQEAKKHGANVAILTDFDDSGVLLGYQLRGVVRFGVDVDTINEINVILNESRLSIGLLQEAYKRSREEPHKTDDEKQNHWKQLKDLAEGYYKDKDDNKHYSIKGDEHMENYCNYLNKEIYPEGVNSELYFEFLETRRIELDSIMTQVDSKVFWIWLRNKIIQTFPNRDYNRAIDVPKFVTTSTITEFINSLSAFLTKKLENKSKEAQNNLKNVKHLIDVNKKKNKINNGMISYLLNDTEMLYFDDALRDFMDMYL